jgi:hypothetical protein
MSLNGLTAIGEGIKEMAKGVSESEVIAASKTIFLIDADIPLNTAWSKKLEVAENNYCQKQLEVAAGIPKATAKAAADQAIYIQDQSEMTNGTGQLNEQIENMKSMLSQEAQAMTSAFSLGNSPEKAQKTLNQCLMVLG